jgi:mitogen-activated protein kinase kinase
LTFIALHISDPSGALNFGGKAVLHATGVDFSNGSSFAINMNQLQLAEELGRGNYGTVKKVLHKPTNVAMAMKVSQPPFPRVQGAEG